ncbi:MAG: glycerate kinase [Oscillospiraceae bacterium]|nr:glycerate kinase [Oscillospiraceae bacterium]
MKKVILAPDSFKGTMSSYQICTIMEGGIGRYYPSCKVIKIPMADGGEGTVDCFLTACGGTCRTISAKGPYGQPIKAEYGILDDGETAVVEMAAAAGLPMVGSQKNPATTTTFGVGQLIADAALQKVSHIIIGLGGSCTNDAGCGAAAACGVKFLDANGDEFVPVGQTLDRIAKIDTSQIMPGLKSIRLTVMCDIDNPIYGSTGAAYVFAPQKGADNNMVKLLDDNLIYFANMVKNQLGIDISSIKSGGAAGGMGAGLYALLSARLKSGIDTMLSVTNFDDHLAGCDMVFTGEGRIDGQSVRGKVISGIAARAKKFNVPVCAVVGDIESDMGAIYDQGVTSVFSINQKAIPFELAKLRSETDLADTFDNILRFSRSAISINQNNSF